MLVALIHVNVPLSLRLSAMACTMLVPNQFFLFNILPLNQPLKATCKAPSISGTGPEHWLHPLVRQKCLRRSSQNYSGLTQRSPTYHSTPVPVSHLFCLMMAVVFLKRDYCVSWLFLIRLYSSYPTMP